MGPRAKRGRVSGPTRHGRVEIDDMDAGTPLFAQGRTSSGKSENLGLLGPARPPALRQAGRSGTVELGPPKSTSNQERMSLSIESYFIVLRLS